MRRLNNIGRIKVFLRDPNKKSLLKMIKEVIHLTIIKKEIPFYYFKYIYRKKVTNYLDYISTGELNRIGSSKTLHKPEHFSIIENKLFFSLFLEKVGFETPKLVSYNLGTTFFYNHHWEIIKNKEEFQVFFERILKNLKVKALFFRPPSEYGGKGCFKLNQQNLNSNLTTFYNLITTKCFIHTEIIVQHDELNKIHGNSVNTMRLISLKTEDGDVEIVGGFYRFGIGDSVVDNASSGGFIVGVNLEKGTLQEIGHYLPEYGGAELIKHPDSNFIFKEFKIPYFDEAITLVKKAVELIPDEFTGWDIAITNNGPVIVEANTQPHIPLSDMAYGGLLKNIHVRKLVDKLNTNK